MAVAVLLITAAPALAHVTLTPPTAAPDQFIVYTANVPNERDDQATLEVDLILPAGFVLDSAQQVPGWQIETVKAADGLPTEVRWTGGRLPVGTFGTFGLQGRNPRSGSAMRWQVIQRYEHEIVRWDGPASSETPAPVTQLSLTAGPALSGGAPATSGPSVPAGNPNAASQDSVARARADLGLVAGVAALVLVLGAAVRRALAGRTRRDVEPGGPGGPGEAGQPPSSPVREPSRKRASQPSADRPAGPGRRG